MRCPENYEELIGQIDPIYFERYLLGNGWVPFETKRNDIAILQYFHDDDFEQVIIPFNRDVSDYIKVLSMAVRDVAAFERRTVEQVLLTLLSPLSDVVRIRINCPDIEPGNIPFNTAVSLYENARKLVAASVRDVLRPGNCHAGSFDDIVRKFVSQCRFGQTEIGGYAVPLVCPFVDVTDDGYKQLTMLDEAEDCALSLTRKVTRHMIEGIQSIKSAVETDSSLEGLVSANFCDAVAGICGQGLDVEVEFQVQWSPVVKQNVSPISSVKLSGEHAAPLRSMSESL